MWGKKKDEEAPPPPLRQAPPPPPVFTESIKKEIMPVSSMPVRSAEPEMSKYIATVGKSVTVKGQIFSREELLVDGEVEGTIELVEHRLTIGPNGNVRAAIKAREIVILGSVQGNVEVTDKIDIRKDAKLVGDIKTARIIIEDGAYFKGSIDIVKPGEAVKLAATPRPAAPTPVQAVLPSQAPIAASPVSHPPAAGIAGAGAK
ncbi:MAG: polymer-forming cytoskeletal protein [Bryobacterales bacterium]|nr:polymer-forming cytoskeletal protein [Bryobacterales bacterium]